MSKVSIVLLTNSKPELLREVLGSLLDQEYEPIEVIVVVNGPHPAIEALLGEFPAVQRIVNDKNKGFAAGMNQGVCAATGEYVYITANDIVLPPPFIGELVRATKAADPVWGLFGGVWRNYSSAAKEVVAAGGTTRFGLNGMRVTVHNTVPPTDHPYDVDWISGAGIFAPKAVWEAFGGYREEFFFHSEDIELCMRVRRAGGYVRVVPSAVLYHHEHPNGISQNHVVERHKLKNYLALNVLYGPWYALPWVCAKFFGYTAPRMAIYLKSPTFLLKTWLDALTRLPRWLRDRFQPLPEGPFGSNRGSMLEAAPGAATRI